MKTAATTTTSTQADAGLVGLIFQPSCRETVAVVGLMCKP